MKKSFLFIIILGIISSSVFSAGIVDFSGGGGPNFTVS